MWKINEFVKPKLKELDMSDKNQRIVKSAIEREMMFLDTISVYNKPDLTGNIDELKERFDQEDNLVIGVDQYNRLVSKANKYDQLKRALKDD